jgi:bile acid:Na+ symporter, BASS family
LKKITIYTIALTIAALCLAAVLFFMISGHIEKAGPVSIAFFITLAIGFRGYAHLKGWLIR